MAVGATGVACIVYLAAALVADVVVLNHLQSNVNSRLSVELRQLSRELSSDGRAREGLHASDGVPTVPAIGDLDDAPLFGWWRAKGATSYLALETGAPTLTGRFTSGVPTNVTLAGHTFRVLALQRGDGTLVAGTSLAQLDNVRRTLLVIEGSLLPLILLVIFGVSTLLGRVAAAPAERSRQEQLDFTADASHELRTPLAVIQAEVGLTLSTPRSNEAYRSALERIAGEAKRLQAIVEDLLMLARLDALPVPLQDEVVDLAEVAAAAVERFRPMAATRSNALEASIGAAPVRVRAPLEWIDRLVSVLLDNACRYSTAGGSIVVGAASVPGQSVLTVDDSGPGISEEQRVAAVRRFHRLNSAPGGAGLGLSIAETIVRQSGATWHIGTSPQGGTRVQVIWPNS